MRDPRSFSIKVLAPPRRVWGRLGHLLDMNSERLAGLGLEPMLTTSELAEYLGVHVQAIYDLRADGRGPAGIRVGRELRYRISDVRDWLDRLHEPERFRASTRFRDWDGQTRQVTASGPSAYAAKNALKEALAGRMRIGGAGDGLTADSPFPELADAWLDDLRADPSRSEGTKEVYERELTTLVLPTFQHFTIREITVGRLEHFLKTQHAKSYPRAKHSRTILSMILAFAVRREIIPRNPVKETSRLKKPKRVPMALTADQIRAIRIAARDWRTEPGRLGPRPDGQVRDVIELMLGSLTRIGETLALRKCDVDTTAEPPTVHLCGTIVVRKSVGVLRQSKPKTDESNRVIAIPAFAAAVVRRRLALIPGDDPEHLLFYSRRGTPLAPHNVRRSFREILKDAGLQGLEITPHAFRRTGATLLTNELGIETAADVLGHTSTKTTKEHYAEPDRSVNPIPAAILERLAPED